MDLNYTESTRVTGRRRLGFILTCFIGLVLSCVWSLTTSCAYTSGTKGFGCQDYIILRDSFVSLTREPGSLLLSATTLSIDNGDYLKDKCRLLFYESRLVLRYRDRNPDFNGYVTESIRMECAGTLTPQFSTQDVLLKREPSSNAMAMAFLSSCGRNLDAVNWDSRATGPLFQYIGGNSLSMDQGWVVLNNTEFLECTNNTALGEAVRSKFAENAFNIGFQCTNCMSMGNQGKYGLGELQKTLVGTISIFGSLYAAFTFAWLYRYKPPQMNEAESSLLPEDEHIRLENDNKT